MSIVDHFNEYSLFPKDVLIVGLRCLSFSKLLADNDSESEPLFQSCRDIDFFLVNLRGLSEGETKFKHAEIAFDLNKKILELDQEELTKHAFKPPASLFGYVLPESLWYSTAASSLVHDGLGGELIKPDADTNVPGI
jgi:hypothetical protein